MSDEVRRRAESGDAEAQFEMFNLTSAEDNEAPEAYQWLTRSASQEYGPALSNLGICFLNGRFGLPRDPARAMQCFALGAKKGSALALWGVGVCCRDGLGIEHDEAQARQLFEIAAEAGLPYAQRDLAFLLHAHDVPSALAWMERAAASGEPEAAYAFAEWLCQGEGGGALVSQGIEWMSALAREGNAQAQAQLGGLFIVGEGVEADPRRGLYWLLRAVEQGLPVGMLRLGTVLAELNPVEAIHWLDEAERHGLAAAVDLSRELKARLQAAGEPWDYEAHCLTIVAEAAFAAPVPSFEVGRALLTARAEAGDAAALLLLAHLSYYGIGVPVALRHATELLRRAAALGDVEARATLAELARYAAESPPATASPPGT